MAMAVSIENGSEFSDRHIGPRDAEVAEIIGQAAEVFLEESERFTDAVRLASPVLRRVIRRLRGTGARTAQAMLGRTVFAVAPTPVVRRRLVRSFESSGLRAIELRVAVAGARPTPLRPTKAVGSRSKGF